jgi:hypothetical protein
MLSNRMLQKRLICAVLFGATIHNALHGARKISAFKTRIMSIVVVHRIDIVAYSTSKVATIGNWHFWFRVEKKFHIASLSWWCWRARDKRNEIGIDEVHLLIDLLIKD